MATETGERFSPHLRGVTVTTLSTLVGLIAGYAAAVVTTSPGDTIGLAIFVGAVVVQYPILQVIGIDISDFSTKDHLYVGFMTFVLWFITWGILLTAGAL
ncbi:MAG: hypothetical protein ACI8XM_001471 [Haloarculaceae archaeon]|jgi:hypothetical protein